MNEKENKTNRDFIDLGSDPVDYEFDPFASDDDFEDEIKTDISVQQEPKD